MVWGGAVEAGQEAGGRCALGKNPEPSYSILNRVRYFYSVQLQKQNSCQLLTYLIRFGNLKLKKSKIHLKFRPVKKNTDLRII